jgi:hypothetical protein
MAQVELRSMYINTGTNNGGKCHTKAQGQQSTGNRPNTGRTDKES